MNKKFLFIIWICIFCSTFGLVQSFDADCSTDVTDYQFVDLFTDPANTQIEDHAPNYLNKSLFATNWTHLQNTGPEIDDNVLHLDGVANGDAFLNAVGDDLDSKVANGNFTIEYKFKVTDAGETAEMYFRSSANDVAVGIQPQANFRWVHSGTNTDTGIAWVVDQWYKTIVNVDSTNTFYHVQVYNDTDGSLIYGNKEAESITIKGLYFVDGGTDGALIDNLTMYYGNSCPAIPLPTITLNYPATNNVTNLDVNFTFGIADVSMDQCTLMHNASGSMQPNVSLSGTLLGNYDFGQIGINNTAGTYLWGVNCTSSGTEYWSTTNNTLTIDLNYPTFTLNSDNEWDINNYSNQNPYDDNFQINISFLDDRDIYKAIVEVTQGTTTYFNYTNITSGSSFNLVNFTNISSWPSGAYDIKVQVADSHTKKEIENYAVYNRVSQLEFYTAEGVNLWIESEDEATTNAKKSTDRYSTEFKFKDDKTKARTFYVKSNQKIDYLKDSDFPGHFVIWNGIAGNWIDFAGHDEIPTITKISDYNYKVEFAHIGPEIKFHSVGSLNTLTKYYRWYRGEINFTQSGNVIGEQGSFNLNATNDSSILDINATLIYNGTNQESNVKGILQNLFSFDDTVTNYNSAADILYSWNLTIQVAGGNSFNYIINGTQTTEDFGLFTCGQGSSNGTFTLYFYDEASPFAPTVSNVEINIQSWYSNFSNYKNFSTNYSGASSYSVCIGNTSLYNNIYFKYFRSGYQTNHYYAFNYTLAGNNVSIPLYLLQSNSSDLCDLRITTRKAEDYSPYPNVLTKLLKKYPAENVFRTVQMGLSGGFGLVPFSVIESSEEYKLIFTDTSNHVLRTLDDNRFECTDSISELNVLLDPYSVSSATALSSISWSYDNNTGLITVNWEDPSGGNIDFTYKIAWVRSNGLISICTETASGTSGSFNCDVSSYYGTVYLTANSTKNGVAVNEVGEFIDLTTQRIYNFISMQDASLLSFIILLPVIGAGFFMSPVGVMIATIFGMFFIYYINLLTFISAGVLIAYCIGGVVISLLVKT